MRERKKIEMQDRLARLKVGLSRIADDMENSLEQRVKASALIGQLTTWEIDLQRPHKKNSLPKLQDLYVTILSKEPNRQLIEQAEASLEEKYRSQSKSYRSTDMAEQMLKSHVVVALLKMKHFWCMKRGGAARAR